MGVFRGRRGTLFEYKIPLNGPDTVIVSRHGQTFECPMSDLLGFTHEMRRINNEQPLEMNQRAKDLVQECIDSGMRSERKKMMEPCRN